MKQIIWILAVIFLVGCGSSNNKNSTKDRELTSPPKSPQTKDVKNIPPSVPKI